MKRMPTNEVIAEMLDRIADLLDAKRENPFRVRSYRVAAEAVRAETGLISRRVHAGGAGNLREVRGIGEKLAALITEFVETGSSKLLRDLASESNVSAAAGPGNRPRAPRVSPPSNTTGKPRVSIDLILDIDAEYREKVRQGTLKMIAPRKLNPEKKAWLPIMAVKRNGWNFTAMFSNTPTAHELGKTDDWVVVYYERDGQEQQCTVVTDRKGVLKGRRIVRGREGECRTHYGEK